MTCPHKHLDLPEIVDNGRETGRAMLEGICTRAKSDCLLLEEMNVMQVAASHILASMIFNMAIDRGVEQSELMKSVVRGISIELDFYNKENEAGNIKNHVARGMEVL